jgi:hypothetical protein
MTQRKEKPFSFYKRVPVSRKKNPEERDKFIFKASAIPWHVHVDLWERI